MKKIQGLKNKVAYTEIQDWLSNELETFKGEGSPFWALCYVEEHHLKEFEQGDIWIVPYNAYGEQLQLEF